MRLAKTNLAALQFKMIYHRSDTELILTSLHELYGTFYNTAYWLKYIHIYIYRYILIHIYIYTYFFHFFILMLHLYLCLWNTYIIVSKNAVLRECTHETETEVRISAVGTHALLLPFTYSHPISKFLFLAFKCNVHINVWHIASSHVVDLSYC